MLLKLQFWKDWRLWAQTESSNINKFKSSNGLLEGIAKYKGFKGNMPLTMV